MSCCQSQRKHHLLGVSGAVFLNKSSSWYALHVHPRAKFLPWKYVGMTQIESIIEFQSDFEGGVAQSREVGPVSSERPFQPKVLWCSVFCVQLLLIRVSLYQHWHSVHPGALPCHLSCIRYGGCKVQNRTLRNVTIPTRKECKNPRTEGMIMQRYVGCSESNTSYLFPEKQQNTGRAEWLHLIEQILSYKIPFFTIVTIMRWFTWMRWPRCSLFRGVTAILSWTWLVFHVAVATAHVVNQHNTGGITFGAALM